ncbi:LamG-like jellyroll fold domain-containing protein [Saccharicrinis sp. FJH62]|uniref:LamG-like jellyroll fold domain-containing protein n=1 Tax=Saccharicrinis sp. FJH62 TaxID=3344657 RepID=UPI0035D3E825
MKKHLIQSHHSLFRMLFLAVGLLMGTFLNAQDLTSGLDYQFTFESEDAGVVTDVVAGAGGTLTDGAVIGVKDGLNVLTLSGGAANTNSPYFSFEQAVGDKIHSYTDFSISCWAYLNSKATWARIFDFGSSTDYYMFFTVSNGSSPRFSFKNGAGTQEQQINAATPLPLDTWVHLVVTLEGSVGKIYVNGVVDGQSNAFTLNPSLITEAFTQNYIGKSMWPDPFLDGSVADFRVYNRALTDEEVLSLAWSRLPEELTTAYQNLTVEGIEEVSGNLTLPLADGNVTIDWASSDTTIIDSLGNVTPPEKYDITVILTATLSMEQDGIVYTMTKRFDAFVPASTEAADLIAQWDFAEEDLDFSNPDSIKVTDVSDNGFVGRLYNDAKIRTIGNTTQYNVLDLGNGTGYFDMGQDFGKEIYLLGDYTISAYYLVQEENTDISSNGNFIWCISNTDDIDVDRNGAMIERLLDHRFSITPTIYGGDQQQINPGVSPANTAGWKEKWHHVLYVQNGSVGTVYIDGNVAVTGSITNLPSTSLKKAGREGTWFNWIGRSCYTADVYLKNTLVYDFRLYGKGLSEGEIQLSSPFGIGLDVYNVLDELNNAYDENKNAGFPEELNTEKDALSLGDLSAVTSDLTLPAEGILDNTIKIRWSSAPALISEEGVVTRPDYLDTDVRLTATLIKGRFRTDTTFVATVLAKEATKYTSDLLIHFNFDDANVSGSTVTDLSEQHFQGTLMNGAGNRTLKGVGTSFGVLNLAGDSSYFDMGDEVGKVIYALKGHFSISTYFMVDAAKTNLADNGNFLYAFSNSDSSSEKRNGYIFGRASYKTYNIAADYWGGDQIGTAGGELSTQGEWHHYAYTQDDTLGIVYFDGVAIDTATIKKWPNTDVAKAGLLGTNYNFLGRSNFWSDAYLAKAMMYDFQLYNKTLSPSDIETMASLVDIDNSDGIALAYMLSVPVKETSVESDLRVDTSTPGLIRILDLKGNESVHVYNLVGRQMTVRNAESISVNPGIYIVKVDSQVKKVLVK